MRILVTGGAGFIGSHLVDRLLGDGHFVVAIDNFSLGNMKNIEHNISNDNFVLIKKDLLDFNSLMDVFKEHKFEVVFHLCANSDISKGALERDLDMKNNFLTTYNVLECMKKFSVKDILFSSTSAVYGDTKGKAVDEDFGPLFPISFYGASKLAAEAYISVYSNQFGINAWIFRFPNVVGERATHGVLFDFIKKLKKDPSKLEVLGDGNQEKPYLYVRELADAMIFCWKNSNKKLNVFNVGTTSTTSVKDIVKIVINEMKLKNVDVQYSKEDRGWPGDVPKFNYNLDKIHKLGWKAKITSTDAVSLAVKKLLE